MVDESDVGGAVVGGELGGVVVEGLSGGRVVVVGAVSGGAGGMVVLGAVSSPFGELGSYLLTGVTVLVARDGTTKTFTVRTRVDFDPIPRAWVKRYAATPEPYDKAGGYGLQGAAGTFIRDIRGSVTNVVGLPMVELLRALAEVGYPMPWSSP